jgi:hypothetical protein
MPFLVSIFVAKVISFLTFIGLSAPLTTIFTCLGTKMGTDNRYLWIKCKHQEHSWFYMMTVSCADRLGMWKMHVGWDVFLSLRVVYVFLHIPPPQTTYEHNLFVVVKMKFKWKFLNWAFIKLHIFSNLYFKSHLTKGDTWSISFSFLVKLIIHFKYKFHICTHVSTHTHTSWLYVCLSANII